MSTDRVILVAGSSGGLGSNVVEYLLKKGHRRIACHYRSGKDKIARILARYDLDPDRNTFFCELTDESSVMAMRGRLEENLGAVDCLVNLAGGTSNCISWKIEKEELFRILDINLTSVFLTCKAFVPAMRKKKWGRIVNVSSIVGSTGVAGASHYAAAKAAVNGFTKSLALELARSNVTWNGLAMGYFDAGVIDQVPSKNLEHIVQQIPLNRLGRSETEIGGMVDYLIGPDAGFLTGRILHVDGGLYSCEITHPVGRPLSA